MSATEAKVSKLPNCSFCGRVAHYDFKTFSGSWAFGCRGCYVDYRLYDQLGLGMGQKLVLVS
jgi:hypothetical protein